MDLPSLVAIEFLHRRLAGSEERFELVFRHSQIVAAIAQQLIAVHHLQVDAKLVRAGALLHDIGVYGLESGEPYIRHGVIGDWLLQKEGYPEVLCRFASRHTGVGITQDDVEREKLPLPLKDLVPETREEQLVAYADKFHSKTDPPRFNTTENIRKDLSKYGRDKLARFDELLAMFGEPDLNPLAETFEQKIT